MSHSTFFDVSSGNIRTGIKAALNAYNESLRGGNAIDEQAQGLAEAGRQEAVLITAGRGCPAGGIKTDGEYPTFLHEYWVKITGYLLQPGFTTDLPITPQS